MTELLDKSKCEIMTCKFDDIRHIFEMFHYKKGAMGGGISICFGMFINGKLVGGSVLGKPRHEKKYNNCIDIRRMACLDSSPKNSESYFLAKIIKWCMCNTEYNHVLSYSDLTAGHTGTIYKAANFINLGETTPTKYVEWHGKIYHPRSLSIDRPYSYKLREAVQKGDAKIITGMPKTIWIYHIPKRKNKTMAIRSFDSQKQQTTLF